MDDFAKLPASERKLYFEKAAANAGHMSEFIIEKDFWVCWTLKRLFANYKYPIGVIWASSMPELIS